MSSWDSTETQENQEGRAGLAEPGHGEYCGRAWGSEVWRSLWNWGEQGEPLPCRAEQSSQKQEWEVLERLCVVTGWMGVHKLPGAAREESSGAAMTSKGVSFFPVKEFPLFLS